jgi:RNA polymerase sigma-B factor
MSIAPAPPPRRARPSAGRRRADALAEERALFARYRRRPDPALRDELVERFMPLARHLAARYDAPGHSYDDIFQVACLALVKAVDRYEPDRGVAFSSYAVPTVVGEIKRYFRDQTWPVHVTRELQERALRVARATPDVARRLGRQPTVAEIAEAVHCTEDEASLDAPASHDGEAALTLADTIGSDDERLDAVEWRADLSELVQRLSGLEQAVLRLRFERDLTQSQIADVLGVSQMHVSRVLRGAIDRLRRLEARTAAD